MSDERTGLAALATGGALGIAAALGRSVRALPAEARRLFALSGLHPGGALDSAAAAALVGVTRARARELLAELDAAHLVVEASPGRFQGARLACLYAAELPDADRADAVRRLLDHTVDAATAALEPLTGAVPPQTVSARAFETAEQALELAHALVGEPTRRVAQRVPAEEHLLDHLTRTLATVRPTITPEPSHPSGEPDLLDRLLTDLLREAPPLPAADGAGRERPAQKVGGSDFLCGAWRCSASWPLLEPLDGLYGDPAHGASQCSEIPPARALSGAEPTVGRHKKSTSPTSCATCEPFHQRSKGLQRAD
ncbi:hypothetical protein [Kitasatospora sp. NPDC093558]|uniref:hypothetical protein n=1 Tax=Kitasatospora sp. NPDC093558 TaxID=3155201 RepID=UPI00343DC49B